MAHTYAGTPDSRQVVEGETPQISRFRPRYRALSDEEKQVHDDLKTKASELEAVIEKLKPGRYRSLAITALEESVMWAVKELTS
jgi:hypothetical protein